MLQKRSRRDEFALTETPGWIRQRRADLRNWLDQDDGLAGDGLTSANGADVLTGLGFDVNRQLAHLEDSCQVGANCRLMGAELGLLGMNDHVAIDGPPARSREPLDYLCQHTRAIGSLPARVGIGVMLSNIAEAGGTQNGIGDGMTHHVGVGVPNQPA